MKDADFAELAWRVNQNLARLSSQNRQELQEIFETHRREVVERFNPVRRASPRALAKSISVAFGTPPTRSPSSRTPIRSQQQEFSPREEKVTDEMVAQAFSKYTELLNARITQQIAAKTRAATTVKARQAVRSELDELRGDIIGDRERAELTATAVRVSNETQEMVADLSTRLDQASDQLSELSGNITQLRIEQHKSTKDIKSGLEYLKTRLVETNLFDLQWEDLPAFLKAPLIRYLTQAVLTLAKISLNIVRFVLREVIYQPMNVVFQAVRGKLQFIVGSALWIIAFYGVYQVYTYRYAEIKELADSPVGNIAYTVLVKPSEMALATVHEYLPSAAQVAAGYRDAGLVAYESIKDKLVEVALGTKAYAVCVAKTSILPTWLGGGGDCTF